MRNKLWQPVVGLTYQVGRFCDKWRMERVVVQECDVCGSKTITTPKNVFEREDYLCNNILEVEETSKMNSIPLLRDLN